MFWVLIRCPSATYKKNTNIFGLMHLVKSYVHLNYILDELNFNFWYDWLVGVELNGPVNTIKVEAFRLPAHFSWVGLVL